MDYGTGKKAVTGFAALSLVGQAGIVIGAILLVILLALLIRYLWRRHKKINKP